MWFLCLSVWLRSHPCGYNKHLEVSICCPVILFVTDSECCSRPDPCPGSQWAQQVSVALVEQSFPGEGARPVLQGRRLTGSHFRSFRIIPSPCLPPELLTQASAWMGTPGKRWPTLGVHRSSGHFRGVPPPAPSSSR